ncbi:MAG: PAS domain S-box protein [Candidatus Omnitrophica bacterium]|nr:PAS domain S-box protein [Candidatus Omnitrophota bacterium]
MMDADRSKRIQYLIFGTNDPLPLQRRVHILLTFFVTIFLVIGFIFTLLIDLHILLSVLSAGAAMVMLFFFLVARHEHLYRWSIMPLHITSMVLLAVGWLVNGGYDGNMSMLILIFFLLQYFTVEPQHRRPVFLISLTLNTGLICIHYYAPHLVMGYDSSEQRFVDMLVSYVMYFILFYYFVKTIVSTNAEEHAMIRQVNDALTQKNAEIAEHLRLLEESETKLRQLYTFHRRLSDTVPDLIWAKDLEKRYIFANTAMCNTLLKAADTTEPVGKTDLFFAERERRARPDDPQWHTYGELCQQTDDATLEARQEMQFFEYGYVRGIFLYLDVRKAPLYDADGNLIGLIGSARDITERKRQEELFKAAEERQRFILESMPVAIYSSPKDPEIDTTWIGGDVTKVTGFDVEEYLSRKDFWRSRLHPEDRDTVLRAFAASDQHQDIVSEYRWMCKDGSYRWFQDRARLVTRGDRVEFHGIIIDITERKDSERKQAESEGRYRTMVENLHQAYYEADGEADFTYCNPEIYYLTGYTVQELTGTNAFLLIAEEDRGRVLRAYYRWREEKRPTSSIECRIRKKNGEFLWIEQTTHFEFDQNGQFLKGANIVQDIHVRKQAELALQKSEGEYRSIFHSVPVAIYKEYYPAMDAFLDALRANGITDFRPYLTQHYEELAAVLTTGTTVDVNDHTVRLMGGNSRADLLGHIRRMFVPETFGAIVEMVTAYAEGRPNYTGEVGAVTLQGRPITVILTATFLRDAQQQLYFLISFQDITDRKGTEEALRRSEVFFRSVWEHSASGMRITDEKGTIIRVNEAYCRMVGKSEQELLGASFSIIYQEQQREHILRKHWERFADRSVPHFLERRLTLWNGTEIWLEVSNSFLDLPGGLSLLLGVFTDVTERKRSEQIILDFQRRESIGVLAGGIAHDFNNLLTAIIGNISLASGKLPSGHPAATNLQRAVTASDRAALLAKQMLAYSGKGRFQLLPVDLATMVMENVNLLEASLPKNAAMKLTMPKEPVVVKGDPGQLEQVVMNLIINAGEAIGDRHGRIDITVSSLTMTGESLRPYGHLQAQVLPPGPYAFLQVSDDGEGMSAETMAKIFDPFFTTKFVGRGLGLSAVLGIIRGHNGGIKVTSVQGEGSVFQIVLPLHVQAASASRAAERPAVSGRRCSILLIDDEEYIVETAKDILTGAGHRPVAETDPEKSSIYPEFAVAGERVYLLWESNGIFMRSSADSGANFGPTATILDEFPGAIGFSKIAAWGPDVYILWPDDRANTAQDYDILLRASHDFGGSFGAEIKLTETAGTTTIPVVKLAATRDKVFAAWHDDGLGTLMRVGEDHGSAFAPHLNLSTFAGSLVGAIQARGEEFFIAWSSFAGGSGVSEIHFARSSDAGMTFEAPQKLAQDRPNVTALELATGGGTVHLTWSDTFEGPANVYLWRTDIPQPVRFVYLIPTDKVFQPCYEQAIRESALNLQRWYQDQMGNGRTFSLHDPIVEAYGTPHDATYYATHDIGVGATHAFYYNARQDGFDLTGGVSDDPDYCWVFYIDADPACGQTGGAALPSSAVLPANDLRGLTGQAVLPKCPEEVPEDTGPCRWVGGLGHELGHALGLPHPPGCDEELPECDIDALMAGGFRDYPSTFLRAEEIDQLNLSPFISTLDLDGEVPDCAIVAQGCLASDLSIRLKPIQAVPDPATLVEGKRTLLRVEVFSSFQSDLEVNIHLVFDTASGQGDVSARAVAHPGKNAYLLPDNQFILPPGDNFSAFAEVSPVDNQVLDLVEGNNDFSLIVPIVKTRPFGVLYVPVKLSNDTIPPPSPPEMLSFRKGSSEYLEGAFPISFVDFMDQVSVVPYVPQGLLGPLDGQGVNKLFKQLDKMAWWDQYSKVVGVFGLGWHASATPHNAVGLALTSRGWDGVFVEKQYVNGVVTAQEIAHTFTWARDHPFNQALDCSAPGVDCYHMVDYPADGYWVSKRMEISATDFMHPSAGSTTQVDRWISGETFDFLLNELRLPPGKDIKQAEPLAVIGISGTIHKSGSVELDPWYRLLGTPDLQLGGNGEYGVRYLDSNGATLGEAAFDLNFEDYSHEHRGELESAPFSLKVPDLPGASELALTHMGEVLVSVPISTHPPEVAVLSPNGGEVYLSGEDLPIRWSSSDTDGGERCHVVSFSLDGGANWLPAAVDLIGQTLTLPVMPGMETEQGLIRVIVTDGVNTAMDTSDAGFSIRLSECPEGNDPCRLLELLSRVKSGQAVGEDLLEWCLTWH